ncbi:putative cyclin [Lupinus albus]|uniref:B-like cyclin n=1 Tax=Lupinus albus TaxID=3870 RepID=A0A6A4PVG1_LUPAL|nr:putative cyclin [Lupinus albus]
MEVQSYRKQLRPETLFLGVSLLDRFLSKGYFKTKRTLQLVGIACLTLAIRIEENQQNNRVGQKNFYIGCSVCSRIEVVAMEWMVQEVLKFQCFLPTIHNFLWFYLKAAKADAIMEKRVKNLSVLALSDHEHLCYWPSTVAAALVILACLEFNQDASSKVIAIHVRSKDENLHECMELGVVVTLSMITYQLAWSILAIQFSFLAIVPTHLKTNGFLTGFYKSISCIQSRYPLLQLLAIFLSYLTSSI